MDLLKKFIEFTKKNHLFNKNDLLFLAVSGGMDSSVLVHLCYQAGFHFKIMHCNFQLRGAESERDKNFVQSLGEKYNVEVFTKVFETTTYAEKNKLSIQVAARELRYNWFDILTTDHRPPTTETINNKQQTNNYILTAHHANDNIETLLMNFFKGTGIQGLKGIEPKSGDKNKIIRPLLFAKKNDIEHYAKAHQLQYVEDSSNAEEKYTRNYFRNQLLPSIQKKFPQVEDNLIDNINRFKEIESLYQYSINQIKKKLLFEKGNEVHIPVLKLLKIDSMHTILYEIIKEYGFSSNQIHEVVKLLHAGSGKFVQSVSYKIIKNRNWIIVSPVENKLSQHIVIDSTINQIEFDLGKLNIELFQSDLFKLIKDNHIAQLNADQIKFPLILRKWKQGDYFYPFGMQKKKKLSRFFIDQKLSIIEKERIWVVEMDRKIIWVIGLRIDDRFKITDSTKKILKLKLASS